MRFFFPDSQDQVDPSFNFQTEQRSIYRVRQRDDRYAHEILDPPPYDGMLVTKPIVDGMPGAGGKYTSAQRNRLYRDGAQQFFRLRNGSSSLEIMGDCGAFTYAREESPIYGHDEVIDFYEGCSFDIGVAIDHVIFGYDATLDLKGPEAIPAEWTRRLDLNTSLAAEFLSRHRERKARFDPVGAAHGWSPASYAASVARLQDIGYRRIALGGMVPLKTPDIIDSLRGIAPILEPGTQLHLLGVTRTAHVQEFGRLGVTSFDSTSPFRQAFKDDKDNYYALDRAYVAIRIPQVDGNTKLRRLVTSGAVNQGEARKLEKASLRALRDFDAERCDSTEVVARLDDYATFLGEPKLRSAQYLETLEARPWRDCDCAVCVAIGVEVILFRGAERNRRRGFHNLAVFAKRLERDLLATPGPKSEGPAR